MAKRGRPPKSRAARVLSGNAGKRPLPPVDDAPLAPGEVSAEQSAREVASLPVPQAPKHLGAAAREEWQRLAPIMVRQGLLRQLDLAAFEQRCEVYSRWRKAKAVVARKGLTYEHNGLYRKRPEVQIMAECERLMRQFDSEYGLTPAARARVKHVSDGQEDLPFDRPAPAQPQPAAPAASPGMPADPASMTDDQFFDGPRRMH